MNRILFLAVFGLTNAAYADSPEQVLGQDVEPTAAELAEKIQAMEARLNKPRKGPLLQPQIDELKKRVDELEKELDELKKRVDGHDAAIEAMNRRIAELYVLIAQLQGLADRVTAVERVNEEQNTRLDDLEANIVRLGPSFTGGLTLRQPIVDNLGVAQTGELMPFGGAGAEVRIGGRRGGDGFVSVNGHLLIEGQMSYGAVGTLGLGLLPGGDVFEIGCMAGFGADFVRGLDPELNGDHIAWTKGFLLTPLRLGANVGDGFASIGLEPQVMVGWAHAYENTSKGMWIEFRPRVTLSLFPRIAPRKMIKEREAPAPPPPAPVVSDEELAELPDLDS